jgi:SH3 domain-containing protein
MQFAYIRVRDAVLALVLAIAACLAGASYRRVLAGRFAGIHAGPRPAVAVPAVRAAAPAPPPARVITKLPGGAAVLDHPASSAQPIAQLRPGAVVEVLTTDIPGWCRLRARSIEGWVDEASVASEAESSAAVALFDSASGATGDKVRAAHAGALYANSKLSEHTGGFLRGESVEILRNGGRILLIAVADGAGGRLVGYARTAEVRALAPPPPASAPTAHRPAPGESDPLAAAAEPTAATTAGPGDAALRDAQDQYASGNFKDALARAEQAMALGSSDASVLAAMSACKLGDLTKALRHAKRLRGTQLSQFRTACPAAEQSPATERGSDAAAQSPVPNPPDGKSPEEP